MYGLQTTLEMAAAAARIAAASTMMAAAGTKLAPTLQRTQPRYQARDVLLMYDQSQRSTKKNLLKYGPSWLPDGSGSLLH